jgi:PAS domain S-box-containing protein
MCAVDRDGRLMYMNAAASKLLGWNEEDLRGKQMHDIVHFQHADGSPYPADDCVLLKMIKEAKSDRITDDAFTRRDGSIFPVSYSAAPLMCGDSAYGVVVVFRDVTEEADERARVQRELDALTWVGRIRDALDDGKFMLHSQPIVPLSGGVAGEEVLLRMIGSNGHLIPPGSFLPTAEKYGLIGEIDQWVIRNALCRAVGGRRVQINLSADSIGHLDLLPIIERELSNSGVDPADVIFEITETALMGDIEAGEAFARGLTRIGCGLALDDFGTGFGSLTYLKNLPFDYLKIDMEFVRDLRSSTASQHLVKAIVNLSQGFGLQTIAEGVEDEETLELLRSYGVDHAQGFHLGRPAAFGI